jgi:hypothetical protein
MVLHTCHLSDSREYKIRESQSRLPWAKNQDPISKITRAKFAGGIIKAVDCLPGKLKTWN